MFCHRCGKTLPPDSKFCNGCGTGITSEQPNLASQTFSSVRVPLTTGKSTPLEISPQVEEKVIFQIRPSFYSVGTAYAIAALGCILATTVIGLLAFPLKTVFVFAALAFCFPIVRHIQRNRIVYTLTPSKIEIDSGILSKTVRNIPLRNVQDVTVSAKLFERMIGVGDVIIDSAAEAGKIRMRQIPDPRKQADLVLQQLHRWQ